MESDDTMEDIEVVTRRVHLRRRANFQQQEDESDEEESTEGYSCHSSKRASNKTPQSRPQKRKKKQLPSRGCHLLTVGGETAHHGYESLGLL